MPNRLLKPLLLTGTAVLLALWIGWFHGRVAGLLASTGWLAVATVALSVPLGALLAVAIYKTNVYGRTIMATILTAMLFVPLYVVAGAWDSGFGMQGWYTMITNPLLNTDPLLTGWRAAIWIHATAAVPWVVLIVGAALCAVEPELEEDAALDATPVRVLWNVSLPRCGAAAAVAALWVAIVCAAEISVTDLFQVRTFAEEVYTQSALGTLSLTVPLAPTAPMEPVELSTVGLWLGLVSLLLLVVAALAVAKWSFWPRVVDPPTRPPWLARLAHGRIAATLIAWSVIALLAGVPLVNLIYKAGVEVRLVEGDRERTWSAPKALRLVAEAPVEHRRELIQSALVGSVAASTATMAGLGLAWSLRQASGTSWLRLSLIGVCLIIPGPLLGIGLIHLLNQPPQSPLAFMAPLYDSLFAPWLVQTIRGLPVASLVLWPALASLPQSTLDSAASEGAGIGQRLFWVALPQRWTALVAAWLLSFAVAVGELSATVLVMPPGTTTIAVKIFSLLHYGVDDHVAAICLVLVMCVAMLTLLAARLLRGGAGFSKQ